MPDDRIPKGSFDWKLSLLLMAIVSICYIGYRIANAGPRPEEVPCAPGQAAIAPCNQELAAEKEEKAEASREREAKGTPTK
jgi:hypothetical protein